MELVVVGLSHRTAPVALRERLAFSGPEAEETLRRTNSRERIPEQLLLSTCNRTELYALAESTEQGRDHFVDLVREQRGIRLAEHPEALYSRSGREMVEHLFRVASSVDSMIVGEAQILGQVHESYEIARRAGTTGPLLQRLLESAFRVGKRVRAETEIGIGAVSVSFAAVSIATHVFSDLKGRTALLIGSGETGALAARHLKDQGVGHILVANRTHERAVKLAEELGAAAVSFEEIETAMVEASIVVTATSASLPILTHEAVRRVVSQRRKRPLLILDIAVPRDVEPLVRDLPNVFLYDIDALEHLVSENLERRRREIPRVEAIIRHELDQFLRWYTSLEATPVIRELRERFEEIRAREVEKHAHRFCEKDRDEVAAVTRSLINKLLHEPTVTIRGFHQSESGSLIRMETVRRLFGLSHPGEDKTHAGS